MRCAIYARKSTEEQDKHEDQKSVNRQVEHGRRFIQEKGWTVAEEHIYQDDGISGAEFQNRPRDFNRKKNKGENESGD